MVRKRFAADGKTDKGQIGNLSGVTDSDDRNKHNAVKGYWKLALLIFSFIAITFFRNCVFDIAMVSGNSMDDTFLDGDVLLVKADTSDIERFDVVTAEIPKQNIVKRVIGLPEETVHIVDGKVFINGEELCGEYAFLTENPGLVVEPYTLGGDEYFLMGDNRGHSYDSRGFGGVNIDQIKGIVVYRLFPFARMGKV